MADKLSGVDAIICIAFSVMTIILLFIFAKRQLTRFKLKSRRGPHVPIGQGTPKIFRQEIDRQLDIINCIQHFKPKLLNDNFKYLENNQSLNYMHRMKVVDILASFENKLISLDSFKRLPNQEMRSYLLSIGQSSPLASCDPHIIHNFVDLYEHARHKPQEFNYEHYLHFIGYLKEICRCINRYYESHKMDDRLKIFNEYLRHSNEANEKQTLMLKRLTSLNLSKDDELMHETSV